MSLKLNSSLQLSFDLLIRKLESGNSENVVVSPMSLDAVVAMLGAGCSPRSAAELLKFADCETVDELKSKFAKSLDLATTSSGEDCPKTIVYKQHTLVHSPTSLVYSPPSPAYSPVSPSYSVVSPTYSPVSPAYSPVSPVYSPTSTAYSPVSPVVYSPTSPAYPSVSYPWREVSPEISAYEPYSPTSPAYPSVSYPWREVSPEISAYEPYSPEAHPYCVTSPKSPAYEPSSPPVSFYRYTDSTDKGPKISFVNAAWVDTRTPFLPEYEECLKQVFKVEAATSCDFLNQVDEAVQRINSWADSQTNGLIKNFVTPADLRSKDGILTNALYFKGLWPEKTFMPEFTEKRDFFLINGEKVPKVPFMTSFHSHQFASFDEFKVLEIPYQSTRHKQFCMQIILPHEQDGLQTLLEKLNQDGFLDFELEDTLFQDLWIPRFKFSTSLGDEDLRFPFLEGGKELKLTKMVQKGEGFELRTCHKAFIEVDEEGTRAAAVTGICYEPTSPVYEPRPGIFVADHPFLFIIKEKMSGLVLFVGTLLNPLET